MTALFVPPPPPRIVNQLIDNQLIAILIVYFNNLACVNINYQLCYWLHINYCRSIKLQRWYHTSKISCQWWNRCRCQSDVTTIRIPSSSSSLVDWNTILMSVSLFSALCFSLLAIVAFDTQQPILTSCIIAMPVYSHCSSHGDAHMHLLIVHIVIILNKHVHGYYALTSGSMDAYPAFPLNHRHERIHIPIQCLQLAVIFIAFFSKVIGINTCPLHDL